jgi:hypothetical protein
VFFKLFLHWSANVRAIFHHLLFIRIYHESSRPLSQLDFKDQDIYRSNPEYVGVCISSERRSSRATANSSSSSKTRRSLSTGFAARRSTTTRRRPSRR